MKTHTKTFVNTGVLAIIAYVATTIIQQDMEHAKLLDLTSNDLSYFEGELISASSINRTVLVFEKTDLKFQHTDMYGRVDLAMLLNEYKGDIVRVGYQPHEMTGPIWDKSYLNVLCAEVNGGSILSLEQTQQAISAERWLVWPLVLVLVIGGIAIIWCVSTGRLVWSR